MALLENKIWRNQDCYWTTASFQQLWYYDQFLILYMYILNNKYYIN